MRQASHWTRLSKNLTPTAIAANDNEVDSGDSTVIKILSKVNVWAKPSI